MSNQKIVTETALSALASDIKTALSGKANSNDVYPKSQTYNRTEIDNALDLKADKSELYNVYPTDQESGSIAHITDGANNIPVKSLVSEIVAVETGNGQPKSPDNPYTISGFDSGIITRCGKNLYQSGTVTEEFNGTFWALGGTLGSNVPDGSLVLNAGTYTLSNFPTKEIRRFDETGARVDTSTGTMTFTLTKREKVRFAIVTNSQAYNVQIEVGTTATYEAYNGNTYTFTFGQTVYGGHFDNKGNLVITHGVINLSEISTGGTAGSGYVWYTTLSNPKTVPNSQIAPIISEKYNAIRYNAVASTVNTIAIRDNGVLYVNNGSDTTPPSGIAVYELATPITLSITSQDIPTLLGENNIYSDTGDVDVTIRADIGLYIDKKISSLAQG